MKPKMVTPDTHRQARLITGQQNPHSYIFSELGDALAKGYTDHFIICTDGLLQCLSNPVRFYESHEVYFKVISCTSVPASLYLIITLDGLYKGTAVEFWEHY